ncbi:MAG: hypothetical protein HYY04_17210 [Chloroflexi bacterium]|nr:hypothetical protein [Chloroflexota bacterium]
MSKADALSFSPSELRQLWLFYEDLKERYRDSIRDEDYEEAHHVLTQLLLPLRDILVRQEWSIGSEAGAAW